MESGWEGGWRGSGGEIRESGEESYKGKAWKRVTREESYGREWRNDGGRGY
jgi:hypothetical protein